MCLLDSYANPVHEREIGALPDRHFPAIPHTLSTDVVPEIGEYERTSTTVINASLLPLVRSYLGSLRTRLADIGVTGRLLVMQSHGGIAGDRAAAMRPAYIVESGPACYALGGTEPTVTDANVVLGYLSPAGLLGGAMRPIDAERATRAIREHIAIRNGCWRTYVPRSSRSRTHAGCTGSCSRRSPTAWRALAHSSWIWKRPGSCAGGGSGDASGVRVTVKGDRPRH